MFLLIFPLLHSICLLILFHCYTLCVSSFVPLLHPMCLLILFLCCTLCVSSFYWFVILWLRIFLSYIVPSLWYDWNCSISLNNFTFVAVYLHWVYRICLFNLLVYYYFCYFHLLFSTFFLRIFSLLLKFIFILNFQLITRFPCYRTCSYHSCDVYKLHLFSRIYICLLMVLLTTYLNYLYSNFSCLFFTNSMEFSPLSSFYVFAYVNIKDIWPSWVATLFRVEYRNRHLILK